MWLKMKQGDKDRESLEWGRGDVQSRSSEETPHLG